MQHDITNLKELLEHAYEAGWIGGRYIHNKSLEDARDLWVARALGQAHYRTNEDPGDENAYGHGV